MIDIRRAFVGDTAKYLPAVIVSSLAGMFFLPILTRLFVPSVYGDYTLAISVLSFLQVMISSWLSSAVIRFYDSAEQKGQVSYFTVSAFRIVIVGSTVLAGLSFGITLLFRSYLESEFFYLLCLVPLLLVVSSLLELPLQVMRARRWVGTYSLFLIARTLLAPLAGVGLSIMLGGSVIGMMWGSILLIGLLVPVSYSICFQRTIWLNQFSWDWAGRLLGFGLPLVPSYLLVIVLDISDRFIIGAYRGTGEAGLYALSYTVAILPISLITVLVTQASAALIVSLWERDGRLATESFLTFVTRIYCLITLPAVIGLSLVARDLLAVFATPEYLPGYIIFPFVSAGGFLIGIQWIAQRGLLLANKTRIILILYTMAGLVNLAANLLLVPRFGYEAAAWTTVASYLLLLVLIALGSGRYLTWNIPYSSLVRSLVACLLMGMTVWFMLNQVSEGAILRLVVAVMTGIVSYGAGLILTREIKIHQVVTSLSRLRIRSLDNDLEKKTGIVGEI